MTRKDIYPGDIITLNNTARFRIIKVMGTLYAIELNCYYTSNLLHEMCNEALSPIKDCSAIIEIERNGKIIWTRPVEMTIAQIEQMLCITPGSLRIKD